MEAAQFEETCKAESSEATRRVREVKICLFLIDIMGDRITAILGAGAVLDFDFSGIEIPTTSNITKICAEQKVQGLDIEEIDLIKQIYNKIANLAKFEYKRLHPAAKHLSIPPKVSIAFADTVSPACQVLSEDVSDRKE